MDMDGRRNMVENNFMLAVRERGAKLRAERNNRITFAVLLFVIGLLVGMAFQSMLSKILEPKAAAAVERIK